MSRTEYTTISIPTDVKKTLADQKPDGVQWSYFLATLARDVEGEQ